MRKKIIMLIITLLAIVMFAVPLAQAAKPTETPITYFREVETVISMEGGMSGESHMYIVKESIRIGSIYEGTDNTGTKLFTFTQWGSAMMNWKQGKTIWHFYMVWTSTTADGGFKGKLNGDAFTPTMGWYTVSGVLQGYGEFEGQKLVVEMARTPPNDALITGVLITN